MVEFPSTELLLTRPVVALDTECTGLCWWKDKVFGASLSWRADNGQIESFYGDMRQGNTLRWFRDVVPKLRKVVNHHIKFDAHMLRESKILLPEERYECTMIREALLDEHSYNNDLDTLSWKYLGKGKKEPWAKLAELFGGEPTRAVQIFNLHRAPYELVEEYANVDSANALQIYEHQEKELREQTLDTIVNLERRLLYVVVDMERGGVRVDTDRAEQAVKELGKEIRRSQKALDRLVGNPVNVNSAPQVKKILGVHQDEEGRWWTKDKVRLEPTESGKSGSLRTEKLYQCQLPEAALIADVRAMIKARDVFLTKYVLGMNHKGYVHATINQTRNEDGDGTYTGRFSITDPALQQIHKRNKKMAAIVRACFLPDEGCEWGCYDWSQKDFRIFAHYVNDSKINKIYADNPAADFHRVTADITGLPRDRDQKTGGANAKQMNLGLIFGMSAGRMAKECNLPYTMQGKCRGCGRKIERSPCGQCGLRVELYYEAGPEAQALFAKYHTNIPGANRLKKNVASVAKSRGYIKTLLGRRLRFPNPNDSYKAAGILFQGQAAESMKYKAVELYDYLRSANGMARLMVLVHDEFDLSMRGGRNKKMDSDIKHILETFDGVTCPLQYRIPILADYGVGPNWWEASK